MKSWPKSTYQEVTWWSTASLPVPAMMPGSLLYQMCSSSRVSCLLCRPCRRLTSTSLLPHLIMPLSRFSPYSQSLFRQLQHVIVITKYYQCPPHTQSSDSFTPEFHSASPCACSFNSSILFQGTLDSQYLLYVKSNSDSSSTQPLSSRQRECNSKRTENCKTSTPKNISDSNQTRIAIAQRSIQLCIKVHSLYAELTGKWGKVLSTISTNIYMRSFKQ